MRSLQGTLTVLRDEDDKEVQPPRFVVSGFPDADKLSLLADEDQV